MEFESLNIELIKVWWRPAVEIFVFTCVFYYSYLFLRGTRAYQVLKGLIILLIVFVASKYLELTSITSLLSHLFGIAAIAVIVLFQPELRRGFAVLGRSPTNEGPFNNERGVKLLVDSLHALADKYTGALIVMVRENPLALYLDSGVPLNADLSVEILLTIFNTKTPLHDGAVIIKGSKIVAASCILPLTQKPELKTSYGTRHRAAIGLSEETDALIFVVSEETGQISLVSGGHIRHIPKLELFSVLNDLFLVDGKRLKRSVLDRFFRTGKVVTDTKTKI